MRHAPLQSLTPDLEWRLIYVASPGNEELDQELDDCLVGPVPVGVNAFEFQGSAPNPSKIPPEDVLGVAEARKATGFVESLGYSLKKMVWS